MIKTGPVDPRIMVGIPPKSDMKTPTQQVARIVSTAPMALFVFRLYRAPNVSVGAITVMNMRIETAIVFWLRSVN